MRVTALPRRGEEPLACHNRGDMVGRDFGGT
jgi:hypothetical protein